MNTSPTLPLALITGATSGIGEACAVLFAQKGYRLMITGRREDRLIRLAETLRGDYGTDVTVLCFDVRNKEEVEKYLGNLPNPLRLINVLINNAGLARGMDFFDEGLMSDWEEMIDTNLKGLIYVSKSVVPYMIEQGRGHIINVGSTAGKDVYQKGNVYCATKHAINALTIGMRQDLVRKGIKVSAVHPGFVETEFSLVRYHGDESKAEAVYTGFEPLKAQDVAETVFFIASAPENVNVADVVLMPKAQAGGGVVHRNP